MMISSMNSWPVDDGGLASIGVWVVLGLAMGLAIGFMCGVSVAKFILHRRVSEQLQFIEAMAKRNMGTPVDRLPKA